MKTHRNEFVPVDVSALLDRLDDAAPGPHSLGRRQGRWLVDRWWRLIVWEIPDYRRGWTTKRWTTKKGAQRGGKVFTKNSLYSLLTNVTYVGKIKCKDEVHNGEQEAIVPDELFQQAQTRLRRNGRTGGRVVRNKHGALLRGLLRCGPCGCAKSHTYTSKGNRRYRYYVCGTAQQRGWSECPSPSVPAGEIERFVVEQIKFIGRDPTVIAETVQQVRQQTEEGIGRLNNERAALQQQLRDDNARLQVAAAMTNDVERVSSLAETQQLANQQEDAA